MVAANASAARSSGKVATAGGLSVPDTTLSKRAVRTSRAFTGCEARKCRISTPAREALLRRGRLAGRDGMLPLGGSHLSSDHDATLFALLVLVNRLGFRCPVPRSWCRMYGGEVEHLSKKQAEWLDKKCCPDLTSNALREIFCAVSFELETEAVRMRVMCFSGYS